MTLQRPKKCCAIFLTSPSLVGPTCVRPISTLYHGLNKADTYAPEHIRLFLVNPIGLHGLMGQDYVGTGCFFSRRAFFVGPPSYVHPDIPELGDHSNGKEVWAWPIMFKERNYENQTNWVSKIDEPLFFLYAFLFLGPYIQDCFDFISTKGSFRRWWSDQRMWFIRAPSSFIFGFIEFITKCLGLKTHGFNFTSKVMNDEQSKRYDQGTFEFGVPSPIFVPLAMATIWNLIAFLVGFFYMLRERKLGNFFIQFFIAGFGVLNGLPFSEAMFTK